MIDRIEGLYRGVGDQEIDEIVGKIGDDKYESEDSFIDDQALNEYFAVEKNIRLRYSGFYIQRGPLEVLAADDPPSPQPVAKNGGAQ